MKKLAISYCWVIFLLRNINGIAPETGTYACISVEFLLCNSVEATGLKLQYLFPRVTVGHDPSGDDLRVDLELDFKTACFGGEEKVRVDPVSNFCGNFGAYVVSTKNSIWHLLCHISLFSNISPSGCSISAIESARLWKIFLISSLLLRGGKAFLKASSVFSEYSSVFPDFLVTGHANTARVHPG